MDAAHLEPQPLVAVCPACGWWALFDSMADFNQSFPDSTCPSHDHPFPAFALGTHSPNAHSGMTTKNGWGVIQVQMLEDLPAFPSSAQNIRNKLAAAGLTVSDGSPLAQLLDAIYG